MRNTAGIVMVLQELNIIGTLTVAENIFLGHLPRRARLRAIWPTS
jgi:ribose transport system ATP-binding protein